MTTLSRKPGQTRVEIADLIEDLRRQRQAVLEQKARTGDSAQTTATLVAKLEELRARARALQERYDQAGD